ncbi:MAG: methylenetetrahydrofolate reductase, partial [Desulfurivibrionaceae bacterium]|nr:methylenetetrahydrofolate reductase [Desulfurivibrionaceae bacterium]
MKSGSRLERILNSGGFAVTGELGPPKSGDPEVVQEKARLLKGNVDAVNITDCQTAIVRMSSIAAGLITLSEGVEPVIQMTCRDRNRIGMQSDILGAAALGLKNLLCLTGDHQKFGNHPGAKGVFDMDSIQLLGMVRDMRDEKKFQCGEAIKADEPRMFLGAAANPFAEPADYRAARLGKKVANGADFIQTQIVYNVDKFKRFMKMVRDLGLDEKVYILAGVTPPRSIGMARYMKNFVPGMDVPDEVIDRLRSAADKEDEGINICVDIINQVKAIKGISGVHIMAIEWESAVPEIVKRAGLADRPRFDDDVAMVSPPRHKEIVLGEAKTAEPAEDRDEIIAAARAEAERLIAE